MTPNGELNAGPPPIGSSWYQPLGWLRVQMLSADNKCGVAVLTQCTDPCGVAIPLGLYTPGTENIKLVSTSTHETWDTKTSTNFLADPEDLHNPRGSCPVCPCTFTRAASLAAHLWKKTSCRMEQYKEKPRRHTSLECPHLRLVVPSEAQCPGPDGGWARAVPDSPRSNYPTSGDFESSGGRPVANGQLKRLKSSNRRLSFLAVQSKRWRLIAQRIGPVPTDEEQVMAEPQPYEHIETETEQGITDYINGILPSIPDPVVQE
ncbi:unnamed protein product [Acanthosepion pharaonis]|uniref:Uncharacterized protein n=1 Tax=Acanthosepion pharaonis TaxID=158019 RepID=A0A812D8G1_ACAPH|nr:unnamed protein product [Sepia pharaonis]